MFVYKVIFEDGDIKEGETKHPHQVLSHYSGKFKRIVHFETTSCVYKKEKETKNVNRVNKKRVK